MYLQDPKTKEPSVSLTLLMVSFICLIIAGGLQLFKVVENTSIFLELFVANATLYFGRKFTVGKLNASVEATDKENK